MLKITRRCPECDAPDPVYKRWTARHFPCLNCGALVRANSAKYYISCAACFVLFTALEIANYQYHLGVPVWGVIIIKLLLILMVIRSMPYTTRLVLVSKGPCCLKCLYDLQGINAAQTSACPECGEPIAADWLDKLRESTNDA